MMKRLLTLTLLCALVCAGIGLAGSAPRVNAAPPAANANHPNADLLPADTALYADFRSADINDSLKFLQDTYQQITGTALPNPYVDINRSLTEALGRPATFAGDIQSWLGDHVSVGVSVPDVPATTKITSETLTALGKQVGFEVVVSIKDTAAFEKFFNDFLARMKASNTDTNAVVTTDTIGGDKITIYTQRADCDPMMGCVVLVQTPHFVALGNARGITPMLDTLKNGKPTLGSEANFTKVTSALKPNSLLTFYVTGKLYQLAVLAALEQQSTAFTGMIASPSVMAGTPAPTMDASMLNTVYSAVKGLGIAARRDGKLLSLDYAQYADPSSLASTYSMFGLSPDMAKAIAAHKIDGKLSKQIPAKALAEINFSGIADIYRALKVVGKSGKRIYPNNTAQAKQLDQVGAGLDQFEAFMSLSFDVNIEQDVLTWANGEAALYMTFNAGSSINRVSGASAYPFDHTLLLDVSDTAKAKAFLTKFNAGLEKNGVKPSSVGDNLYTVTIQGSLDIAYGLVGNTFFVTTGSGLTPAVNAIKGDGTLANDAVYKNAQANAIKNQSQFWFVNMTQVYTLVRSFVPASQATDPQTKQGLNFLALLESASISTDVPTADGLTTVALQITLK